MTCRFADYVELILRKQSYRLGDNGRRVRRKTGWSKCRFRLICE
jgi:hypothetical protein